MGRQERGVIDIRGAAVERIKTDMMRL